MEDERRKILMVKKRQSNIELLRIVLILMVITLHYMNAQMGGVLGARSAGKLKFLFKSFD